MRDLIRPLLPVVVVLLLPIVPFVAWGDRFEAWVDQWREHPPPPTTTAGVAFGLLTSDIFLPIPSSVVSTLLGSQLGGLPGTLVSWAGMTAGAVLGFALARRWGQTWAFRMARPQDLDRIGRLRDRLGPLVLVVTRGVPVLAEASVLWMGMHGLPWRRFWTPILFSNLGLALAYSWFGAWAETHGGLPLALAFSIAFPVLLATILSRAFRAETSLAPAGDSTPSASVSSSNVAATEEVSE